MFELNNAFLMVTLHGLLSFSVSSIKELVLTEGAVVIFAFAFSMHVWTFLLMSDIVFKGNILAI